MYNDYVKTCCVIYDTCCISFLVHKKFFETEMMFILLHCTSSISRTSCLLANLPSGLKRLNAVEPVCLGLLLFFLLLSVFVYCPVCNTIFECKNVEDLLLILPNYMKAIGIPTTEAYSRMVLNPDSVPYCKDRGPRAALC